MSKELWDKDKDENLELLNFSEANAIEEKSNSRLVRGSVMFISATIFLFILWAIFTSVDEVAVTFGDIQPVKEVQVIQHLEGGIVTQVFVKNGDEVNENQTLLQLKADQVQAELHKEEGKALALELDAVRYNAFIDHIPDDKVDWSAAVTHSLYNTPENSKQILELILAEVSLLKQQNEGRKQQEESLKEKVIQKEAQLTQLVSNKTESEQTLALHLKEEAMLGSLVGKGYVSQRDYLAVQRNVVEARSLIMQLISQIDGAKSGLQESKVELAQLNSTLNELALKELNKISEQLLESRHTVERLSDINKRLTIRTPIAGIVKGMSALPGTVLSPGEKLMEIIPTEGEMLAQTKLNTRDVGYIHVGDPVDVKVTAYDFARYGSIKGHVIEISASTFTSKEGLPYYQTRISLEKNYVGGDPKKNILKPGMTVQADIVTNKKSIMAYILKPITRALDSSFRER